jgi:hypothetical protein
MSTAVNTSVNTNVNTQSLEETLRLFDEYQRGGYAPPDLIMDGDNGKAMFEFVIAKWGIVSITYLREAEKLLGPKLKRKPQPSRAQTESRLAEKLEAKMQRDYLDSLKPQRVVEVANLNSEKADAKKKEALVKELKSIESQIESEISRYVVTHPYAVNAPDYSRTEGGRDTLRKVRDTFDRRHIEGAKAALDAVRIEKSKLP